MGKTQLIKEIEVSKKEVEPGESFQVSVKTQPLEKGERVDVYINGLLGNIQYLQLDGAPGARKIRLTAASKGLYERTEVIVNVIAADNIVRYPRVTARMNPFQYLTIDLDIVNAAGLNLQAPSFLWDFGDGQNTRTSYPAASHYYGDSLDSTAPYTSLQAKITIREDGRHDRTLHKTLTIWNYSYLDKINGLFKPRVETGGKAVRSREMILGSFIIHNTESDTIQFVSRRIDFLSANSDRSTSTSTEHEHIFGVSAKQSSIQTVEIPYVSVPRDVFGFAVHLRGKSTAGLSVSASAYLAYKDPPGVNVVSSPAATAMLNGIRDRKLFSNPNVVSDESLYQLLREGRFSFDTHGAPSSIMGKLNSSGALSQEPLRQGSINQVAVIDPNIINITNDGNTLAPPVLPPNLQKLIGQECDCGGCPYPDPRVTCQLTNEVRWVRVPAHFPNANKGDAILSPGGNGTIGRLLHRLSPPQLHSHSAIMTKDYFEFRHSTASEDRLNDESYFTGSFLGQAMPTEGLRPDHLKYGWPGTVTQSVDTAYLSSQPGGPSSVNQTVQPDPTLFPYWMQDPENQHWYPIRTSFFSPKTIQDKDWILVYPMVIKPPWQFDFGVRELLHQIADQVIQLPGHYRFYAYTAADVSRDSNYVGPASAGWASGTLPTVCSSTIWTSIQLLNLKLASQGRKQIRLDGSRGGPKDNQTADGLYFYTEPDRQNAASELYNDLHTQAQESIANKIPSLLGASAGFIIAILSGVSPVIPALAAALGISQAAAADFVDIWTNVPAKIANQVCNAFASDWCDTAAADSTNWMNPSVGRAVSPDNIMNFWDQPNPSITNHVQGLYGFAEPLLTVPGRWEQRQVCRWTQSLGIGKLIVRVNYHGSAVPGALVQVACQEAYVPTDGDPQFKIPSGRYLVSASVIWTNGWYLHGSTDFTITPSQVLVVEVVLQDPPVVNRKIIVDGWMDIYDKQVFGSDNWDHPHFHQELLIGPPPPSQNPHTEGTSASFAYDSKDDVGYTGGETHVGLQLEAIWLDNLSAILRARATLFDGDDVDQVWDNYSQPWVIAKDTWQTWNLNMDNGEPASDGVTVHITMTNNRQSA